MLNFNELKKGVIEVSTWYRRLTLVVLVFFVGVLQAVYAQSEIQEKKIHAISPVAWVVFAKNKSLIYPREGYQAEVLSPLRPLFMGNLIEVPDGQKISIIIAHNKTLRHYSGPALLKVKTDVVSIVKGQKAKIFPAKAQWFDLAKRWSKQTNQVKWLASSKLPVVAVQPLRDALVLSQSPTFEFRGELPRDSHLIIFQSNGKRFWVQPVEDQVITFPPAAAFQPGETYNWELRRKSGGRVLQSAFTMATAEQSQHLVELKNQALASTTTEKAIMAAVRLQLAQAYSEAEHIWAHLGLVPYY